jgi:hypothetical protein
MDEVNEASDAESVPLSRTDPIGLEGWRRATKLASPRPSELQIPSGLMTRSDSGRSKWSIIATRGSRAPIVYLGLVGLAQVVLSPDDEARYDDEREEWKGFPPRGTGSLEELFGYRGPRGHSAMTTALRQLMSIGLLKFPRRGAKGYGAWRRFDILDPSGEPYIVPSPRPRKSNGYNIPFSIGMPVGFWSNGWLLELGTKEIETLLCLLYQRERQPTRPEGRGWFISPGERQHLCLDAKTYGVSHLKLVQRGVLTPVDGATYWETRSQRGRRPRRDLPHEFLINVEVFDGQPPAIDAEVANGQRDPAAGGAIGS